MRPTALFHKKKKITNEVIIVKIESETSVLYKSFTFYFYSRSITFVGCGLEYIVIEF